MGVYSHLWARLAGGGGILLLRLDQAGGVHGEWEWREG